MSRVALVLVAHAAELAHGAALVAGKMAPGVAIESAGGMLTDDGEVLGTDLAAVRAAVERAGAGGRGVVVLSDLGSAVLASRLVLQLVDAELAARVLVADAPLVEGAVAAAVRAGSGGSVAEVLDAAHAAGQQWAAPERTLEDRQGSREPRPSRDGVEGDGRLAAVVPLGNSLGLHARPAALLARLAGRFDAQVTVDGAPAASIFELMKLGAQGGQELHVVAAGPQAREALDEVARAIADGFGED